MQAKKILSFCIFSTLCFIGTASFAAAKKIPTKNATGICANDRGDYVCLVYNYSEKTVTASYPKMAAEEKSAEQRAATFPSRLIGDTGAKYTLIPAKSANFKPFTVNYLVDGKNGCAFTFSAPAKPEDPTVPTGYVVSSAGVGDYSNDSCQHDGATLTVKEN